MNAPAQRIEVHTSAGDHKDVPVGTAYFAVRRGITTTTVNYDDRWLATPGAWEISPDLRMREVTSTTAGLPGAFADSAPDRWGRNLIRKRLEVQARTTGATPTFGDVDFLLGVSDTTRQGALRFTRGDGGYLGAGAEVPKLIELPRLLAAARTVEDDSDETGAIMTLLDAGSGSLGGARPKASVHDDGKLMIAKFPHGSDEWDVMGWEMVALDLAELCGVDVPPRQLVKVGSASVVLIERFDRAGTARIPYISAMTLLGRTDGSSADYLEIAEALTDHSSRARDDLHRMWDRVAVSLAINNTDDHLRNHGFLRHGAGWSLSPAFDLNPNPDGGATRVTSLSGAEHLGDCAEALIDTSDWFDLDTDEAAQRWETIRNTVRSHWQQRATTYGIAPAEQSRFAHVFT